MNIASKGNWVAVLVMTAALAGCASQGTGQKTGEYVDDAWITTKVKSELATEDDTKARNISVNTSGGTVTLGGTAETMQESWKAEELARGVKGVTGVHNEIRVQ